MSQPKKINAAPFVLSRTNSIDYRILSMPNSLKSTANDIRQLIEINFLSSPNSLYDEETQFRWTIFQFNKVLFIGLVGLAHNISDVNNRCNEGTRPFYVYLGYVIENVSNESVIEYFPFSVDTFRNLYLYINSKWDEVVESEPYSSETIILESKPISTIEQIKIRIEEDWTLIYPDSKMEAIWQNILSNPPENNFIVCLGMATEEDALQSTMATKEDVLQSTINIATIPAKNYHYEEIPYAFKKIKKEELPEEAKPIIEEKLDKFPEKRVFEKAKEKTVAFLGFGTVITLAGAILKSVYIVVIGGSIIVIGGSLTAIDNFLKKDKEEEKHRPKKRPNHKDKPPPPDLGE
ncbi:MAG: hypothetical protein R3D00_24655 [Bacteroidia bacterium]